jgi:hypothetical protein
MARPEASPYQGNYRPSGLSMTAKELKAGLKGLKIRQPNKKYSGSAYKTALPKQFEEQQ